MRWIFLNNSNDNSELESTDNEKSKEKTLLELLDDVKKSIHKTMQQLYEEKKLSWLLCIKRKNLSAYC